MRIFNWLSGVTVLALVIGVGIGIVVALGAEQTRRAELAYAV